MNEIKKRPKKKRKEFIESRKKVKKTRTCLKCEEKFETYYYYLCVRCQDANYKVHEFD